MQEIYKSVVEIEEMFRQLVCGILGVDVENSGGRIRFSWGSNVDKMPMSAPNLKTDEDVCFIQLLPEDNAYNRQRDIRYVYTGGENMLAVDEHTDVHSVLFVNYGVNAYESARKIRNGLHQNDVRRFFRLNNFALITDVPAIRRVPELVNSNWVNRVDVYAEFNQFVRLIGSIRTIEQIGVTTVPETWNPEKLPQVLLPPGYEFIELPELNDDGNLEFTIRPPNGNIDGSDDETRVLPPDYNGGWPDGIKVIAETGDLRAGIRLLRENGNIKNLVTARKE
jgi:hypothetical protein